MKTNQITISDAYFETAFSSHATAKVDKNIDELQSILFRGPLKTLYVEKRWKYDSVYLNERLIEYKWIIGFVSYN